MEFINSSIISDSEKLELFKLWNNEYPEQLSYKTIREFEEYLENLAEQSHILLMDSKEKVRGWYFEFIRDNEKWFVIIVDSNIHGKGYGTRMLKFAKQKENELNGWVIDHDRDKKKNGEPYISPLKFYLKNGFEIMMNNRLELDNISAVKIKWRK